MRLTLLVATFSAAVACSSSQTTEPRAPDQSARPRPSSSKPRTEARTGPVVGSSDGPTCEEAQAGYVDEVQMGKRNQKDLSTTELGAPLNNGAYLNDCEVPDNSKVDICAAVQNGKVVGVTVGISPSDPDREKCVAARVRGISFPSHPKMDVVRTSF